MSQQNGLIVNPHAAEILNKLGSNIPHAILLTGPRGVGLKTIAKTIAGSALASLVVPINPKSDGGEGAISIETIRKLYEQTRSKRTSHQVIVIDDANLMSLGAQSAFLKLLEEPGVHTKFILTSHQPSGLLPTIRSRVQQFRFHAVPGEYTDTFMKSHNITDPTKQAQLRYLADGLPAELTRLIQDPDRFNLLANHISDARILLQASAYEKAITIQKYKGDRAGALRLIDAMIAMLRRSASANPQHTMIVELDRLLVTRDRIAGNCNVNLQLMKHVI